MSDIPINPPNDCEHDGDDWLIPRPNGRLGERKCLACQMEFIYCHPCSLAGGAEMAIYHEGPACS